jgi:hypothetical protein
LQIWIRQKDKHFLNYPHALHPLLEVNCALSIPYVDDFILFYCIHGPRHTQHGRLDRPIDVFGP